MTEELSAAELSEWRRIAEEDPDKGAMPTVAVRRLLQHIDALQERLDERLRTEG